MRLHNELASSSAVEHGKQAASLSRRNFNENSLMMSESERRLSLAMSSMRKDSRASSCLARVSFMKTKERESNSHSLLMTSRMKNETSSIFRFPSLSRPRGESSRAMVLPLRRKQSSTLNK